MCSLLCTDLCLKSTRSQKIFDQLPKKPLQPQNVQPMFNAWDYPRQQTWSRVLMNHFLYTQTQTNTTMNETQSEE